MTMSSNAPALDAEDRPVRPLVAKFADISGSPDVAGLLVQAAAMLVDECSGRRASVGDVERLLFGAFSEPLPAIRTHPKAKLVRAMLLDDSSLSDQETEDALNFLGSHVAIKMQGEVAEVLGLAAVVAHLRAWRRSGLVPEHARLVEGRSIRMMAAGRAIWCKGADGLIGTWTDDGLGLEVHGIVEVKSRRPSWRSIRRQLNNHRHRLARGLRIDGRELSGEHIRCARQPLALLAAPKDDFGSTPIPGGITAIPFAPSLAELVDAGYGLVLWMIEKMGQDLFVDRASRPEGKDEEEAAKNAFIQALHYARMRPMGRGACIVADKMFERCCG